MDIYRILYRSMISGQQTKEQIEDIVKRARIKNKTLNISGVLLVVDDYFMQVLEGPKEEVRKLYYKQIYHDRRHGRVKVLTEGYIPERDFADWEMGLGFIEEEDSENLELKNRISEQSDLVYEILNYFYQTGEVELNNFWMSRSKS